MNDLNNHALFLQYFLPSFKAMQESASLRLPEADRICSSCKRKGHPSRQCPNKFQRTSSDNDSDDSFEALDYSVSMIFPFFDK